MNNLIDTIDMLRKHGYKRVGVCIPNKKYIKKTLIPALNEVWNTTFCFRLIENKLVWAGAEFFFFCYEDDAHLNRIRGQQFDAGIIVGKCSEEFRIMFTFGLRLGNNPIRIHIKE